MSGTSAGRSAFYQYFGDLYDLAEAMLRGLEADIFDVATHWLEGEGDPVRCYRNRFLGWWTLLMNAGRS